MKDETSMTSPVCLDLQPSTKFLGCPTRPRCNLSSQVLLNNTTKKQEKRRHVFHNRQQWKRNFLLQLSAAGLWTFYIYKLNVYVHTQAGRQTDGDRARPAVATQKKCLQASSWDRWLPPSSRGEKKVMCVSWYSPDLHTRRKLIDSKNSPSYYIIYTRLVATGGCV